jgi:hypothetical protein
VNRTLEHHAPWRLPPDQRRPVVATVLHALGVVVDELEPFTPELAARARERLQLVAPGPPLVPRLEVPVSA